MRAIKIDAKARTVTEIDLPKGIDAMQAAIGCDCFCFAVSWRNGDTLYVDDEGLLNPCDEFFVIETGHQPFAGNGLILGSDEEGESVDAKTPLTDVKVAFLTRAQVATMFREA